MLVRRIGRYWRPGAVEKGPIMICTLPRFFRTHWLNLSPHHPLVYLQISSGYNGHPTE